MKTFIVTVKEPKASGRGFWRKHGIILASDSVNADAVARRDFGSKEPAKLIVQVSEVSVPDSINQFLVFSSSSSQF